MTGKVKGFIVFLVSLCVLILLGGGIGVFARISLRQKAQNQVAYQLSVIDRQIESGHLAQAEQLLEDLKSFSADFVVLKPILKRVFQIAQKKNDYKRFAVFTADAFARHPGERDARNLYVYALLKTSEYDKAWSVANDAKASAVLPTLLSEAALRCGKAEEVKTSALDSLSRAAITVALSDDPNGYLTLSQKSSDPRLMKNRILSLALAGDIAEAFALFEEKVGKEDPVLGSYLAYDAGALESAYSYAQMSDSELSPQADRDWLLFHADLALAFGVTNEAAALYADFVQAFPDYSYVPYYNLAYIYRDMPETVAYMEQGVSVFPGVALLNLKLADDYVKLNEIEKAKTTLENFLKIEVDHPDAALAYEFLLAPISPERFIGALWNLYNNNRKINEKIPRAFLWYLTGLADSAEIDRLLIHCRRDYGERSWIDFYDGVSAVLKEDFAAAYEAFSKCSRKAVRETGHYAMGYQPFYNCALLSLYFGFSDRALTEADAVYSYIDWNDKPLAAAVHVLYGRIYLMQKEFEKAMRSFRLAHDLDPANIEVISYIDYLNSGIEK